MDSCFFFLNKTKNNFKIPSVWPVDCSWSVDTCSSIPSDRSCQSHCCCCCPALLHSSDQHDPQLEWLRSTPPPDPLVDHSWSSCSPLDCLDSATCADDPPRWRNAVPCRQDERSLHTLDRRSVRFACGVDALRALCHPDANGPCSVCATDILHLGFGGANHKRTMPRG